MTGPVWSATDPDGDTLDLYRRIDLEPDFDLDRLPQVIGSLHMYDRIFSLECDTARGMRYVQDRLLVGDEQPAAPDPAASLYMYMGRRAAAIGLQLDEH